jgi:hypothetical protein
MMRAREHRVEPPSGRTCTVSGIPRVIAVDQQGRAIGPAATHDPSLSTMTGDHPKVIVLEAGGVATFQSRYGAAANFSPRVANAGRRPSA